MVITEKAVAAITIISGLCTIIDYACKAVAKIKANLYRPKHTKKARKK